MRIVSTTSNFKVPVWKRVGRRVKLKDPNLNSETYFRAQEKNSYNIWVDVSPLLDKDAINAWLDSKGFERLIFARLGFGFHTPTKKVEVKAQSPIFKDNCPDCGAKPGEHHGEWCDVERCPGCGGQMLMCGMSCKPCQGKQNKIFSKRARWTGRWPGEMECEEFGWYSYLVPYQGWKSISKAEYDERIKNGESASHDFNRLHVDAKWDVEAQRYVKKDTDAQAIWDILNPPNELHKTSV